MPLIFPTLLHAWLPLTKTTGNEGAHPATTCLCRRANTRADVRLEGRGASCLPAALGGAEIGIHPPCPASVRLCSLHCRKGSTVGASKPSKGACEERSRMDRPAAEEFSNSTFHWCPLPPTQKDSLESSCLRASAQAAASGWSATPSLLQPLPAPPLLASRLGQCPLSCLFCLSIVASCLVMVFFFFFAPTGFLKHKNSHTMSSPCPAESGIQNFCRTNHCTQWCVNLQC